MRHAGIDLYRPSELNEEMLQQTIAAASMLGKFILNSSPEESISELSIFTTGTSRTRETLKYVKNEVERVVPTNTYYGYIDSDNFLNLTDDQKKELNRLATDSKNGILVIGHKFTLSRSDYLPLNFFEQNHNQIIATFPDGTCAQVAPTLINPFSI